MLRAYLFIILVLAVAPPASSADQDLQQWSLVFVNQDFGERWAASFQIENRMSDNASEFNELILKPGGYYSFTPELKLGVGYKHQKKNNQHNEEDIWEELFYTPGDWRGFSWTHQVRLEQRYIGGVSGTIHRLRYLVHAARPFASNPNRYFAASQATRFNLNGQGEGPVQGFEQNRLYFGVGFKTTPRLNIEFGYLWRYERQRDGSNLSDHVIRLQFLLSRPFAPPSHGGS
jgi:hypothetical protein